MSSEEISFEERLNNAKKILDELSKSDLPLDKGISLYKDGMKLLDDAFLILENAKLEVKKIEKNEQ